MSRLTHTLLEFAKASGSAGGLELANIRVDEIILELPAQLVKVNPAYNAIINFDELPEEDEKLVVYGNKPLLETAIKNIVINACKYSPDHQATIRLNTVKAKISISVEDKGEGIPPEEIKTIFQPFYRIENNTARMTDGFGLGLSLSYRIIRLHNGEIHVRSKIHEGTVFRIELPVANYS
jgi:signal transduction histidine kinase